MASRVNLHELAAELNALIERQDMLAKELARVTLAHSWNWVHVRKAALEDVIREIERIQRRIAHARGGPDR